LAKHNAARRAHSGNRLGILIGDIVRKGARSVGGSEPTCRQQILHGNRQAMQRPKHVPPDRRGIRFLGIGDRLLTIDQGEGIDGGIEPVNAAEERRHHFARGDLLLSDLPGKRGCRQLPYLGHVDYSISWCHLFSMRSNAPTRKLLFAFRSSPLATFSEGERGSASMTSTYRGTLKAARLTWQCSNIAPISSSFTVRPSFRTI